MAKIRNKTKYPLILSSPDGDSIQIQTGVHNVDDKFIVNPIPQIEILSQVSNVRVNTDHVKEAIELSKN